MSSFLERLKAKMIGSAQPGAPAQQAYVDPRAWRLETFSGDREPGSAAGRPIFVVGTGRCGTHFISEIFKHHSDFVAKHMDDVFPEADALHLYFDFCGMSVDPAGLLWARRCLIGDAGASGQRYLEANPMLSGVVNWLWEDLDAKIVLVTRDPRTNVPSIAGQGRNFIRKWHFGGRGENIGVQYDTLQINHSLGNMVPGGEDFASWDRLSEFGKASYYWRGINERILSKLERLPEEDVQIVKIEELNYDGYKALCEFCETSPISEAEFREITDRRPGKRVRPDQVRPSFDEWPEAQKLELRELTGSVARQLGYPDV